MWILELSAAIQAERTRDMERRTREWRLLHPEPVDEPSAVHTGLPISKRPAAGRRATSTGTAAEPV